MRADRRTLFDDDDRDSRVELFEPDRRGEPRGTRADDHDVVFHRFAGGQFGSSAIVPFAAAGPCPGSRLRPNIPRGSMIARRCGSEPGMIVALARAPSIEAGPTLSSTNDSRRPPLDPIHAAEALRWWFGPASMWRWTRRRMTASPRASAPGPNAPASANEHPRPAPAMASAPQSGGGKPPEAAEIAARALAEGANDLEALRSAMAEFDGCALKRTATQLVFADGVPGAKIMFVGEAPGGTRTGSAARSSAAPGNCWTACLPPSASIGAASISPMSSRGGRLAIARRRSQETAGLPAVHPAADRPR